MAFRLEITQVGKFPTSWSLTKLQDFGTMRSFVMRRSTLLFAPMKTYGSISVDLREKRKEEIFFFSLSILALPSVPPLLFTFDFYSFYYYYYYYYFLFLIIIFFSCFIFTIISSTWHLAQCESFTQVHHMSCHVDPNTRCLEKREIPTFSESDEIRQIN